MSNLNRYGNRDGEKLTAEFTSGQLVIGICVSLFVALVCFLLGVLVGRYDGARTPVKTAVEAPQPPATPPPAGVQMTPNTDAVGGAFAPGSTAPTAEHAPWPAGRVTEMQPLPSPTQPAAEGEQPVAISKDAAAGDPAAQGSPAGVTVTPPAEVASAAPTTPAPASSTPPAPVAAAPASPGAATSPAATAPATTAPANEPGEPDMFMPPVAAPAAGAKATDKAAAAKGGKFSIQIAAFHGAGREAAAQAFVRRAKGTAGLTPQIVVDAQRARVLLTGYKDRAAAAAACAELRKKPGFADAFVTPVRQAGKKD